MKQEDKAVSTYFTKMKAVWDELKLLTMVKPCTCGHGKTSEMQQRQDRAIEFLQGRYGRYSAIHIQILLMDPFLSPTRIYVLVRQEEKQQEIHSSSPSVTTPDAAALSVNLTPVNIAKSPHPYRANASINKEVFCRSHPKEDNRSNNWQTK